MLPAALLTAGCTTAAPHLVPTPGPVSLDAVPTGRHLVGTVNRVSDTELVLDVYGGPPPLTFVIRPQDRANIDVQALSALAGGRERVRVFYESTGGKDYALRVERA